MIKSWSPSRLEKYEQCPARAKYDIVQKLCPSCFAGKLRGDFGETQYCDSCGAPQEVPGPIARGTIIGESLEMYVNGTTSDLHHEIKHPKVLEIAKDLRAKFETGKVKVEHSLVFDKDWRQCAGDDWNRAWLRVKLDVQISPEPSVVRIIDWKTGGIDKRTGAVRAEEKYNDQLNLYAVAALTAYPTVERTEAALVFVDCGARFDPVVERPAGVLTRADLPKAHKRWSNRAKAILSDRIYAPRPSGLCGYCPFRKDAGGPCQY